MTEHLKALVALLALGLAGCSGLTAGAVISGAKEAANELVSPQLIAGAYAKCTSEIETAKGPVNEQKLLQAEHLLGAMETAQANGELVGALRLEIEKVCGDIDTPSSGDAIADLRAKWRAAADAARQPPE